MITTWYKNLFNDPRGGTCCCCPCLVELCSVRHHSSTNTTGCPMKDIVMINTPTALQVQPPPERRVGFTPFLAGTYGVKLELVRLGVPLSVYLTISIVVRLHYEYQHHLSQGGTLSLALYTVKHCSFHTHDILVSSFKLFTKLERGGRFIIHNTHGPVSMGTAILQNGKIWSLICQWGITT